jgi:hypothetical protein
MAPSGVDDVLTPLESAPLAMPSLRDIRRRVRAIRNGAKITRPMELFAAARLRRAQMRMTAARPSSAAIEDPKKARGLGVKFPLFRPVAQRGADELDSLARCTIRVNPDLWVRRAFIRVIGDGPVW